MVGFTCTHDLNSFHKPSGTSVFRESKSSTKLLRDKPEINKNAILIFVST